MPGGSGKYASYKVRSLFDSDAEMLSLGCSVPALGAFTAWVSGFRSQVFLILGLGFSD